MYRALFATKPVETSLDDSSRQAGLKRTLGAMDLTLLGIGVVMGTGIFVLTGRAAAVNAGPAIAISFLIAGVAAALAGLCYSEMASMIPVAGSAYTYAYATLGELTAFVIGWDLILEYLVGAATVTVGWSGYFTTLLHHLTGYAIPSEWCSAPLRWNDASGGIELTGAYLNLPAVLFALSITAILIVGVRESARANAFNVGIKLLAVFLFIAFAARFINRDNWQPFLPTNTGVFGHYGLSGLFQGATMVFFAYIGFDAISTVAQETRQPQRDLPIGMLASLGFCTLMYVVVSLVLTGLVPYDQLSVPHPIALGIAVTQQPWLETIIELGALAGLTSGALVMLMGQPRIFYAMAKDGLFPRFATRVHPKFGTPHITTAVTGVLCATAGGLLPIDVLGELTSIGTLFAFVVVSAAVPILRHRRPDLMRRFRVPGGPYIIPLTSAMISGALMCTATPRSLLRLFVWMALGLLVYASFGFRNSRLRNSTVS